MHSFSLPHALNMKIKFFTIQNSSLACPQALPAFSVMRKAGGGGPGDETNSTVQLMLSIFCLLFDPEPARADVDLFIKPILTPHFLHFPHKTLDPWIVCLTTLVQIIPGVRVLSCVLCVDVCFVDLKLSYFLQWLSKKLKEL